MGVDATMLESGSSPSSTCTANFLLSVGSGSGSVHKWWADLFLMRSGTPAWKRLIEGPLNSDVRVSLIAEIFSDREETEMVKQLRGDDAQSFVDVVVQVISLNYLKWNSCLPCQVDAGQSRATTPEEVSECIMQDVWSPGSPPKIIANLALL